MREATKEEQEGVNRYIESISKPTGVNFFDLLDGKDIKMKEIKLLPCPFCGNHAELEIKNDNTTNYNTRFRVGCVKLGCQAHFEKFLYGKSNSLIEGITEDIVKKWNTRI